MSVAYVVTSGSYSDYGINAVFSTKELAEEYIAFLTQGKSYAWADEYDIEEWEMDEGSARFSQGYRRFSVIIRKDGFVSEVKESWPATSSEQDDPRGQYFGPFIGNEDWRDSYRFIMTAKSKEQAIKVANERRTVLLATNQWGVL